MDVVRYEISTITCMVASSINMVTYRAWIMDTRWYIVTNRSLLMANIIYTLPYEGSYMKGKRAQDPNLWGVNSQ